MDELVRFVLWVLGPALGLTYGITSSDLLAVPRGFLQLRWPRWIGVLVGCPQCTGFWCGAAFAAGVYGLGLDSSFWFRVPAAALSTAGIFWQLSAFAAAGLTVAQAVDNLGRAMVFGRHPSDATEEELTEGPDTPQEDADE